MRAAFKFSFAISDTIFDLKAYDTVDESKVEIKRTTAFKDAVSGQVSPHPKGGKVSPEAKVAAAKISRVSVSNLTGEVVSDTQTLKGVWRAEDDFVEVSDDDLASLRIPNGEFRVVGRNGDCEYLHLKGSTYLVAPAKEGDKRFLTLLKSLQEQTNLVVEGSVRNKQRVYLLSAADGVLLLDEVAYVEEHVEEASSMLNTPEPDLTEVDEIDLSALPEITEPIRSSYLAAFNEKYGEQ